MSKGLLTLIGPFKQVLTMDKLPSSGSISDDQMEIISDAGILIHGDKIQEIGGFNEIRKTYAKADLIEVQEETVALPGFIDPHTHICFSGSRSKDYAMRIAGKSYLEIANEGGGIWQTVQKTREASKEELAKRTLEKSTKLLQYGITTAEVKSGYGLTVEDELKMLNAIREADDSTTLDLIPTCLAAHIVPRDFHGETKDYLEMISAELLPKIKTERLAKRIDIFIEEGAFSASEALSFLTEAKKLGFEITIHGDQFTTSGSIVAIEVGACSVDHLESATRTEIEALANSKVIATVLPGASLGLGMQYAPARKLLDSGCSVAIGSDWNPGSAPMGNLLTQASLLSAHEKLSNAETFAGLTFRAAKALNLHDRGVLTPGKTADFIGFPCADFREILYHQGELKPNLVTKKGIKIS